MHKVIVPVIQHRDWTIETVMQSYLQSFVGKRCWWQHLLLCHTLPTYEIYWLPDIPKKQWPEASREPWATLGQCGSSGMQRRDPVSMRVSEHDKAAV